MIFLLGFLVLTTVAAAGAALHQREKRKKAIRDVIDRIDKAMEGRTEAITYDESLDALLNAKLKRFLEAGEEQRQKADREKEAVKSLISDITHQTKTPLANILLRTQLLTERTDLLPEVTGQILSIENQAEKLNFLIGTLLKTSYLEGGLIQVRAVREELEVLLSDVCEEQDTPAAARGITLRTDWPDFLDTRCTYDYKWTREAVSNLLDNAIKYSPEGSFVTLSLTRLSSFLRLDVTDLGIGIDESETGRIFARFYRSPAAARYPGVGIGLYLSRRIAEEQGGYLKVHSKPGRGSTFSLYLPL